MLDNFINHFHITNSEENVLGNDINTDHSEILRPLIQIYGGKTLNNGLYRIHTFKSSLFWSSVIAEYFTKYTNKIHPFGFDWMGRQFCINAENQKKLLMFDPATGENFVLEQDLLALHDDDFVKETDDMLGIDLFNRLLEYYDLNEISYEECLGYKVPLFLNGKDSIENYEKWNLEVYWHFQHTLYEETKRYPNGTIIKSVNVK